LLHLLTVAFGTKQTYRHDLLLVRFRSKADMQAVKSFRYLLTDPYELNILLHRPTGG
jgi:hypothetical protein